MHVIGGEFALHAVNGNFSGNGNLLKENLNLNPETLAIDDSVAINIALEDLNSAIYFWQDTLLESELKIDTNDDDTSYFPKPELCILKGSICYRYRIHSASPLISMDYFISATTGSIVEKYPVSSNCNSIIANQNFSVFSQFPIFSKIASYNKNKLSCSGQGCISGSATLDFYGNQTVEMERYNNSGCEYKTKDICIPANISVREWHNSYNGPYYKNNSGAWGTNFQEGTTPLWCAKQAYRYFKNNLLRNSWDNQNSFIDIWISNAQSGGLAAWVGNKIMIGPSGNGANSRPYSLDIISHELTHGLIQHELSLPTNNSPGGTINEALCDMFGITIDQFVKTNFSVGHSFNWLFADEVYSGGLRDFSNPKSKGNADTYGGTNWTNSSNKYKDVGVLNYWFYLLVVGSNGVKQNDNGQNYCVKPIGINKAIDIIYTAIVGNYYNSNTNYSNFRAATVWAASDKYGYWSPEVAEIQAAFHAVGIGFNNQNGTNAAGPFANMPYVLVANRTDAISKNYNFNNIVRHQNYIANGGATFNVSSAMEVILLPNTEIHNGTTYSAYIAPACSSNSLSGAKGINSGVSEEPTSDTEIQDETIEKVANNFIVIPNPSDGNFKVLINNVKQHPTSVSVVNALGHVLYENQKPESNEIDINISNLTNGFYMVKLNYEGRVFVKRIIKN